MSDLVTAPGETPDVVKESEHVIEPVRRAPILITSHEVALNTAAAVSVSRTKPTRGVIAALRAMFLSSRADTHPARRHHPSRRDSILNRAATAREMRRL
jgi:hypothetical protein